ncbi:MAG: hypothetical protein HN348_26810, partial [Proteobacteria bacterium]|nr:hypothetical protein [Pseudomonadota bacterium]
MAFPEPRRYTPLRSPYQAPVRGTLLANRYALLSVSDKNGLVPFARQLCDAGFVILSTGGTAKTLAAGGVAVPPVDRMTNP